MKKAAAWKEWTDLSVSAALPKVPDTVNMDLMTTEQIYEKLQKGYDDIAAGNVQNAADAFATFREKHLYEALHR